ncbi:MAG: 30S ribosomal protein S1 [Candidatus Hydrogenedentes bacterium]|nr:30S ribosomal protein S1 [Candidatus Hydrogenedentota bacterium]
MSDDSITITVEASGQSASQPASSILDRAFDLGKDEELTSEEMDALYSTTMQDFREGEVVRGIVVEVTPDRVLVDIGYKSEGTIATGEFTIPGELAVGDEFDVYIEAPEDDEGMPILSKIKADRIKNWAKIQKIYEDDGVIEGKIIRRVKGGLKVDIGIDAFMPASQLTWRPTGDLERYLGETMEMKIIKLTKRRRNVVVSRRKLLEEQRAGEKNQLLATIEVGKLLPGEVKNITDFGAFVDVGGIDGLLHVTDMSWGRVKHPSHVVSVGDKIDVMVLNFDPKTERISLGLKQKSENPWKSAEQRYPVGGVVAGKVVSMTDYGAFVQLEQGIEGMVHVSEMSWTRRVRHPSEVVTLDTEIDVMVLSVSPNEEKIALGIKQTVPNPWNDIEQRYPVGSVVKGEVRNLADYGAFVQIEEGIDGLLHVSDLSWTQKYSHPSEAIEKGQKVEVKILSIDPNQEKISVGVKQLEKDPWEEIAKQYPINTDVECEVAKLVSFGAFARLDNGIEGLIHVSEIGEERVQKPEDALEIGQKLTARVISIDPIERKIGLSVRAFEQDEVRDDIEKYSQSDDADSVSVGDAVGDALPKSLLQAGGTLADAANAMMASVKAAEAHAVSQTEEAKAETTPETPKPEETAAPVEEAPKTEEAAAPVEEAPKTEEAAAEE